MSSFDSVVQQMKGIIALRTQYLQMRQTVGLENLEALAPQQAASILKACATAVLAAVPEAADTPLGRALAAVSQSAAELATAPSHGTISNII